MVVQIRKYNDMNKLIKEPIEAGDIWSAMAVQPEGHFEPMLKPLLAMPIVNRHSREATHMDGLQGDNKAWKRYYAVNSEWV